MSANDVKDTSTSTGERLQKIIAQAGIASRRDAEELIREGKVTVNGKTANLGDKATLGKDSIKVRGKLIHAAEQKAYYLIYKPKNMLGLIQEDEDGRPTLHEFTKRIKERVFTVGRMDFTSEGIILLTNDGEVAQKLQKSNDIIRRYHVKVDRHPTPTDLEKLARGGRLEGKSMTPFHVRLADAYAKNALVEVSFEGMSALDIRKFFENKGFYPERVACVGIGHISADKMAPGSIKKIEGSSIEALFTQPELAVTLIEKLKAKKAYVKKTDESADANTGAGKNRRDVQIAAPRSAKTPFGPSAVNAVSDASSPFERSAAGRGNRNSNDSGSFSNREVGASPRTQGARPGFGNKKDFTATPRAEREPGAFGDKTARDNARSEGKRKPARPNSDQSYAARRAAGAITRGGASARDAFKGGKPSRAGAGGRPARAGGSDRPARSAGTSGNYAPRSVSSSARDSGAANSRARPSLRKRISR